MAGVTLALALLATGLASSVLQPLSRVVKAADKAAEDSAKQADLERRRTAAEAEAALEFLPKK